MNDGVFEAGIAKELEQDFQNLLQDRFDEAKEIESKNYSFSKRRMERYK